MIIHYNIDEVAGTAQQLLSAWLKSGAHVLALYGGMGAGKTTLIRQLVKAAGSRDEAASPTYALCNSYELPGGKLIQHMDWYRLENETEVAGAGLEEIMYDADLCIVEWPERGEALLPDSTFKAEIVFESAALRKLIMHNTD